MSTRRALLSLDFVRPKVSRSCRADSDSGTNTVSDMKAKTLATATKVKSRIRATNHRSRPEGDEPDAFRRALERWTVRFLLLIAATLLGTEVLPWLVQRVRHCLVEMLDDHTTRR